MNTAKAGICWLFSHLGAMGEYQEMDFVKYA